MQLTVLSSWFSKSFRLNTLASIWPWSSKSSVLNMARVHESNTWNFSPLMVTQTQTHTPKNIVDWFYPKRIDTKCGLWTSDPKMMSKADLELRLVISSRLLKRNKQTGWQSLRLRMVLVLLGPAICCTSPFFNSQREWEMTGTDWEFAGHQFRSHIKVKQGHYIFLFAFYSQKKKFPYNACLYSFSVQFWSIDFQQGLLRQAMIICVIVITYSVTEITI